MGRNRLLVSRHGQRRRNHQRSADNSEDGNSYYSTAQITHPSDIEGTDDGISYFSYISIDSMRNRQRKLRLVMPRIRNWKYHHLYDCSEDQISHPDDRHAINYDTISHFDDDGSSFISSDSSLSSRRSYHCTIGGLRVPTSCRNISSAERFDIRDDQNINADSVSDMTSNSRSSTSVSMTTISTSITKERFEFLALEDDDNDAVNEITSVVIEKNESWNHAEEQVDKGTNNHLLLYPGENHPRNQATPDKRNETEQDQIDNLIESQTETLPPEGDNADKAHTVSGKLESTPTPSFDPTEALTGTTLDQTSILSEENSTQLMDGFDTVDTVGTSLEQSLLDKSFIENYLYSCGGIPPSIDEEPPFTHPQNGEVTRSSSSHQNTEPQISNNNKNTEQFDGKVEESELSSSNKIQEDKPYFSETEALQMVDAFIKKSTKTKAKKKFSHLFCPKNQKSRVVQDLPQIFNSSQGLPQDLYTRFDNIRVAPYTDALLTSDDALKLELCYRLQQFSVEDRKQLVDQFRGSSAL